MTPIETLLSLILVILFAGAFGATAEVPARWKTLYASAVGIVFLMTTVTLVIGGWQAVHNTFISYGPLTYIWFALLGGVGYMAWLRRNRIVPIAVASVILLTIVTMPSLSLQVSEKRFTLLGYPEVAWSSSTPRTSVKASSFVNWQPLGGRSLSGQSGREKVYVEGTSARIVARARNPVFPWCTNTRVAILGM